LLAADIRIALTQSFVATAHDDAWRELAMIFARLNADVDAALTEQQVAADACVFTREIDMRYVGQSFELTIPGALDPAAALAAFHARHERRYGFCAPDDPVQIVTARVIGVGTTAKPPIAEAASRERLQSGNAIAGPAVVEQYDSTTYIAPDFDARVDAFGNLIITARANSERAAFGVNSEPEAGVNAEPEASALI
jgi:N-methylhydantoinase A/oxoprolinase/acetone carboxylase beta subunit